MNQNGDTDYQKYVGYVTPNDIADGNARVTRQRGKGRHHQFRCRGSHGNDGHADDHGRNIAFARETERASNQQIAAHQQIDEPPKQLQKVDDFRHRGVYCQTRPGDGPSAR